MEESNADTDGNGFDLGAGVCVLVEGVRECRIEKPAKFQAQPRFKPSKPR